MSIFLIDAGREWRESQRQVLYVARELRKKGLPAHIVAEPGGDLLRKASEEGLATIALRMHGRLGFTVKRSLARHMRARACKLAHVHETFGAGLGLAAAAAAEVPIRILSRPADSSPLEGKLPFASIDAVVAGSDGVRSILARGGIAQDRIEVVPPGLDFSRFTTEPRGDFVRGELGFGPDDFLVGAVLPLEDERGLRSLLDAAGLARAQSSKVKVVVLGEGSLRLESGAPDAPEPAPPAEGIHYFLGVWKNAPKILASLDMFVVFSHLDGLQGFLIEAMAARPPRRRGGRRDVAGPHHPPRVRPPRPGPQRQVPGRRRRQDPLRQEPGRAAGGRRPGGRARKVFGRGHGPADHRRLRVPRPPQRDQARLSL